MSVLCTIFAEILIIAVLTHHSLQKLHYQILEIPSHWFINNFKFFSEMCIRRNSQFIPNLFYWSMGSIELSRDYHLENENLIPKKMIHVWDRISSKSNFIKTKLTKWSIQKETVLNSCDVIFVFSRILFQLLNGSSLHHLEYEILLDLKIFISMGVSQFYAILVVVTFTFVMTWFDGRSGKEDEGYDYETFCHSWNNVSSFPIS